MKALLVILLAAAVHAAETNKPAATDEQLGDKLAQAIMLGRVGLYEEAEAACNEILAQKPDQPTAKQLLAEIGELKRKRAAQDPGYTLRHKLEQLVIAQVNFRDAKLPDVIEFLREESQRAKFEVNFVWLVPDDAKLKPVTLNLRNVTFADVLNYVTQPTGLKYRVDAHAVVIYKPEPERPIPPATEPNAKSQ